MHFIFLCIIGFAYATQCTFIPPSGWEIAQPKTAAPHVKIGFLGKGSTEFRPSINLALEEGVDVPFKEYIKTVKELHKEDPKARIRDLGTFPMRCGQGALLEISSSSAWGEIKVLQALFVKDETAYILTAAVLKDDLPKFQKDLLSAMRTLQLTDNLCSLIANADAEEAFTSFFNSLGSTNRDVEWEQYQKKVAEHTYLGPYWVFLMLQEGYAKIYKRQ